MPRVKTTQLDLLQDITRMDQDEDPYIGFSTWALTQCTLPYQNPKPDVRVWTRRNGKLSLMVTPGMAADGTSYGFPYGTKPRLLLAWLCREALTTRSPVLELGPSLNAFMAQLGLSSSGGKTGSRGQVGEQLRRLMASSLEIRWDDGTNHDVGGGMRIARGWDVWWERDTSSSHPTAGSRITLSADFFNEIIERPVPLNMAALKILRGSAVRLDLYAWLTSRMFRLNHPITVSWESLRQQFGSKALPKNKRAADKALYDFKRDITDHLRTVLAVYHEARVEITDTGLRLSPSPVHVPLPGTHAIARARRATTRPARVLRAAAADQQLTLPTS